MQALVEIPQKAAEEFITKTEVARRLKRPVRTITNWMRRGWIPYYKIGRAVNFKWSEVEAELARQCHIFSPPVIHSATQPSTLNPHPSTAFSPSTLNLRNETQPILDVSKHKQPDPHERKPSIIHCVKSAKESAAAHPSTTRSAEETLIIHLPLPISKPESPKPRASTPVKSTHTRKARR